MAGSQSLKRRTKLPDLPADAGSYALLLILAEPVRLAVGRLGVFDFSAGQYLYFGSAHGPGGLRGRLAHHLRPVERPHWHIDYLRAYAEVRQVWWAVGKESLECAWSQALIGLPGVTFPAPGFGASDCKMGCVSHLVGLGENVIVKEIFAVLTRFSLSVQTHAGAQLYGPRQ